MVGKNDVKLMLISRVKIVLVEVVVQLVEWSLLAPKIRGSNPGIGKILSTNRKVEKTKIKKKGKEWPIFRRSSWF